MPVEIYRDHRLGDMIARYVQPHDAPGALGLVLIPASRAADVVTPREHLTEPHVTSLPAFFLPIRAWSVDRLVHVALRGDPLPNGFAQGRTLRDAPATAALKLRDQQVETTAAATRIRTTLAGERGLVVEHVLEQLAGERVLRSRTTARNEGPAPLTLELLTSFSLGGLTPFAADEAPGRLWIHRFRSTWSLEGRPLVESAEDLHLEPSWVNYGVRCERFGVAGSHPVSGWFPSVAVEDRAARVSWGAQLVVPGSWQLELYRRQDQLALSGGLADRELGHWSKTLAPGESLTAPEAWLTVADGAPSALWPRLQDAYRAAHAAVPAPERELPPVFNEWCTSWGAPTHDNLVALADRLRGSGVRYLVIDDGWAERPGRGFQQNGDWIVSREAFPSGLRATCEAIRERGLIPGIWFEFEVCNPGSKAWDETAHHLHRDGHVIQVGTRRFWDFRDPWVHDYLAQKVIALLRDNGIGYLKVDYNDTIGLGCDGAESPGAALQAHLAGVLAFFERLRRELPELVIENCASGGHRESAAFIGRTAMTSFSDAHETPNIPLIAANLLPLVPPRQSQIWAVLRAADTERRLVYSLAATFLGRLCLSGEVHALSPEQWALSRRAITLHQRLVSLIAAGQFTRGGAWGPSYNHPAGWQSVVWTDSANPAQCLVVLHAFADAPTAPVAVPLPPGPWRIAETFAESAAAPAKLEAHTLHWLPPGDFSGACYLLARA